MTHGGARSARAVAAAAALLVALCSCKQQLNATTREEDTRRLFGSVELANGDPGADCPLEITARSVPALPEVTQFSDSDGHFSRELTPGSYVITVNCADQQATKTIHLEQGEPSWQATIITSRAD